jgi:hypothetical protein
VVVGEESAEETGIRERSIELLFSKRDIGDANHKKSFLWLSCNTHILHSLGRSLLDAALDTQPLDAFEWFKEGREFFSDELPLRILDNLCFLYAGLCLLAKLCGQLGVPWPFPYDRDACTKHIQFAVQEYLLDGGFANKSIVEQSLEVMSPMPLKPDVDYCLENNNRILCLHFIGIYDKYTRYRRDCAIIGEVLSYSQFKKQLEKSEFFIAKNRAKRFGDTIKKVWIIDFKALSQRCDVAGFIREAIEPEEVEPLPDAPALT